MTRFSYFFFISCIVVLFTSCDNRNEPVEPEPPIFDPPYDPPVLVDWPPPESCGQPPEVFIPYFSNENFETGYYGRAPDERFDENGFGGIGIRYHFGGGRRTTRETNDPIPEYRYIGVMGGTYFKGVPFEDITTLGGIAISGLPHNTSLYEAKIRFTNGDEIDTEIKSIEEVIPSLTGTDDFSHVAVVVPTDPNTFTFSSESETFLDFIFWFKVPLEENQVSLLDVNIIPILVNEEQEYKVVNPQRIKLTPIDSSEISNLPENFEMFTLSSNTCIRAELLAELTYFNVNYNNNNNKVLFEWKSSAEKDNAGFNIWCAKKDSIEKPFKINDMVIASNAISLGDTYYSEKYLRENSRLNSGTQYCAIETIDNNGLCNIHCDLITEVTINGNKYPSSNNELAVSEVRSSCETYKVLSEKIYGTGMCLDRLLRD